MKRETINEKQKNSPLSLGEYPKGGRGVVSHKSILVIDSQSDILRVGLVGAVVGRPMIVREHEGKKDFDKNINLMVEKVLKEAQKNSPLSQGEYPKGEWCGVKSNYFTDLSAYAVVNTNAGSWTGTRVGVVATLGFAMAVPKPIIELESFCEKEIMEKFTKKQFTLPENLKPKYCSEFVVNAKR